MFLLKSIIIQKDYFSYYVENNQWKDRKARRWERYEQREQFKRHRKLQTDEFALHQMVAVMVARNGLILIVFRRYHHHDLLMNWMWGERKSVMDESMVYDPSKQENKS